MASENETVQGLTVELWPIYELKDDKWRPCANIVVRYNNEIIDLKDTNFDYYFDQHPVRRFRDVTDLKTGAHNFKCVVTYKGETKISSVDAYFNELTQSECIPNTPIVPEVPDVPPTSEPDEPTEPTTPVETKAKLPNYIKYPYLARGSFNPKTADIGRTYYTNYIKIIPTTEELEAEQIDLHKYGLCLSSLEGTPKINWFVKEFILFTSDGKHRFTVSELNHRYEDWLSIRSFLNPDGQECYTYGLDIPSPEYTTLMVKLDRKHRIVTKDNVGFQWVDDSVIFADRKLPTIENIRVAYVDMNYEDEEANFDGMVYFSIYPRCNYKVQIEYLNRVNVYKRYDRGNNLIYTGKPSKPFYKWSKIKGYIALNGATCKFENPNQYLRWYAGIVDEPVLGVVRTVIAKKHFLRFRYVTNKGVVGDWSYFHYYDGQHWENDEGLYTRITKSIQK